MPPAPVVQARNSSIATAHSSRWSGDASQTCNAARLILSVGKADKDNGFLMVKYALICENSHEFEGWFPDSAGFEAQQADGHVACPHCASLSVRRALMAPALASPKTRARRQPDLPDQAMPASGPSQSGQMVAAGNAPARAGQMMQMLREMHRLVQAECRPVGKKFAEEALKMHRGEAEPEGIWGSCTADEREQLEEEGVDFAQLPDLPPDN